jgi:hypothetical protein
VARAKSDTFTAARLIKAVCKTDDNLSLEEIIEQDAGFRFIALAAQGLINGNNGG